MNRKARFAVLLGLAFVVASPASAHLMNTGFGPFYDGLAHPLVTPEDLLPVVAIALLAGLQGARSARFVVFLLPSAWLCGMVAARVVAPPGVAMWATPVLTIGLGALVASDRRLPLPVIAGSAIVLGLLHGWFNGAGLTPGQVGITGAVGVICTVFVLAVLLTAAVVSMRPPWARIVVRVVGSWLAAIGLLMLGWVVRKS